MKKKGIGGGDEERGGMKYEGDTDGGSSKVEANAPGFGDVDTE